MSETQLYPEGASVKRPWQSKTLWVNAIMAIGAFVPGVQAFLNEQTIGTIFLAVNTVLRFTTKSGISIK